MILVEESVNPSNKTYTLLNSKKLSKNKIHMKFSEETKVKKTVLAMILAHIFMSGGAVKEGKCFSALQ